jgi:uncharacterized BrkB/YihY/UPF0761 family membrane protein
METAMPEPARETVIIVHGTFAAQDSVKRGWYEPVDGRPGGEPFPTKLDAALQARGSQARCWAHCTEGNRLFEWWPGENSWIARTRAAASLGKYVADLQAQGWRCHIVAHSHGGNVLFGALPQIVAAAQAHGHPGTITTLGTPFIDTQSLIFERRKQGRSLRRISLFFWLFLLLVLLLAMFLGLGRWLTQLLESAAEEYFDFPSLDLYRFDFPSGLNTAIVLLMLLVAFLMYAWPNRDDIFPTWLHKLLFGSDATGSAQVAGIQPRFLAISSRMDEPWQLLHGMRSVNNPLAIGTSLFKYLFSSLRSRMALGAQIDSILGAKSFKDGGLVDKVFYFITWFVLLMILPVALSAALWIFLFASKTMIVFGLFFGLFVLTTLISPFLGALRQRDRDWKQYASTQNAPFRWYSHLVSAGRLLDDEGVGGRSASLAPYSAPFPRTAGLSGQVPIPRPQLLAISSAMDEAWQILHHVRTANNPLAVQTKLRSYLSSTFRSYMERTYHREEMLGAKPWAAAGGADVFFAFCTVLAMLGLIYSWVESFGWIWTLAAAIAFIVFMGAIMGAIHLFVPRDEIVNKRFNAPSAAPFRWCARLMGAVSGVPISVLTYFVRRNAWRILQAIVMGLEGNRFELPSIARKPDTRASRVAVSYEDLPDGAEQRALDRRGAWVARHLGDVSQTFSKLAVTATDITLLLRTIEEDQTLVHAAYYTDDECIARIADWIAAPGSFSK